MVIQLTYKRGCDLKFQAVYSVRPMYTIHALFECTH